MAKPHRRDVSREAFWRQAMAEFRNGGDSVRAFCARRGLAESAFYFWRQELLRRDAEPKPAFVPVTVVPGPEPAPAAAGRAAVEVRCPSGHVVAFASADASVLGALFAALAGEVSPC